MKIFLSCILLIFSSLYSEIYDFLDDPIDVVIPCHAKDLDMLEKCIAGIKKNGQNIRRVIVVSSRKLTENAEFFSEKNFPFSKDSVISAVLLGKNITDQIQDKFIKRSSWIYQQLLKLYAAYIIPEISTNVLILDADTVFLKPVSFTNPTTNAGLFNVGTEYNQLYFAHAKLLIPGFRKVYNEYSGICHHMLFQKSVLDRLFAKVQAVHNQPFWQAFCKTINPRDFSGCSEYEIYFNYAFMTSDQFSIRKLDWKNAVHLDLQNDPKNFHYVSCHSYCKKKNKKT